MISHLRLVVAFCLAVQTANAGVVVVDNLTDFGDTSYFTGVGANAGTNGIVNESAFQQFDAPVGGQLLTIDARLTTFLTEPVAEPLFVSVFEADGIFPGALIGQIEVPGAAITLRSGGEITSFDFSGERVSLEAGTSYLIGFSVEHAASLPPYMLPNVWTPPREFGYGPLVGRDGLSSDYLVPRPDIIPPEELGELGLRITAVPEPGSGLLLSLLGLIAIYRRTERRVTRG